MSELSGKEQVEVFDDSLREKVKGQMNNGNLFYKPLSREGKVYRSLIGTTVEVESVQGESPAEGKFIFRVQRPGEPMLEIIFANSVLAESAQVYEGVLFVASKRFDGEDGSRVTRDFGERFAITVGNKEIKKTM